LTSCSDVLIEGNTIPAMKNLGATADSVMVVSQCSNLRIVDNLIGGATLYQLVITGAGTAGVQVANNVFDGGCAIAGYYPILLQSCTSATVTGNVFKNASANTADFRCDTTTNLVFENNVVNVGYSIDASVAPSSVFGNVGPGTRTYRTAAPTGGTWVVGDKVWFESPTSGGYIGAVCTVAGTPGTWKNFGVIA